MPLLENVLHAPQPIGQASGRTAWPTLSAPPRLVPPPSAVILLLAALLLTGTGIVPPDEFTLQSGDDVSISIAGIGTLRNPVA